MNETIQQMVTDGDIEIVAPVFNLGQWAMGMISGQGMATSHIYDRYEGTDGRTWLVASDVPNKGDHVYCSNPGNAAGPGFGGATLPMRLTDGTTFMLNGGWHANGRDLLAATGVDVRSLHHTRVVVGLGFDYKTRVVADVLHLDPDWTLGLFGRGEAIAAELTEKTGQDVYYAVFSMGGPRQGWRRADEKGDW